MKDQKPDVHDLKNSEKIIELEKEIIKSEIELDNLKANEKKLVDSSQKIQLAMDNIKSHTNFDQMN